MTDCVASSEQRIGGLQKLLSREGIEIDPQDIPATRDTLAQQGLRLLETGGDAVQGPVSEFLESIQRPDISASNLTHAAHRLGSDIHKEMMANGELQDAYQPVKAISRVLEETHGLHPLAHNRVEEVAMSVAEKVLGALTPSKPLCP